MIDPLTLEKTTRQDYIPHSSSYVICIDESGSVSYAKTILKLIQENKNELIDYNRRYFTLCAVIFKIEDYMDAIDKIDTLKNKFWKNGKYHHKDGINKKVCLHSSDIRRQIGAFSPLNIIVPDFIEELSEVLDSLKCTVIAINIDLHYFSLNGDVGSVYETAFNSILERYIYFAPNNATASIYFESRGQKEDNQLLRAIKRTLLSDGLEKIHFSELKNKIDGVYFNKKWRDDSYTYVGLEIADLFAYPIYKYGINGVRRKDFEVVEKKIYGYPNRIKFGLLSIPKK